MKNEGKAKPAESRRQEPKSSEFKGTKAEELFQTLAINSPTAIYIVQDRKFRYVNPQFQTITGYSTDELVDADPLNYIFPADRQMVRENAIAMLKGRRPAPYEYRMVNRSGETRWILETVAPIQYGGRRATLGNCMDTTETHRLWRKMVEYQELNKLKSALFSTVSHELRNPLATIKGYSTMMLEYDHRLTKDEKQEYLHSIDRATNRLTELVEHLLDMSRLEAGLLKLEKSPTPISHIIKESVADWRLRGVNHGIILDMSRKLPIANVDPRRIRQVLDNLIDNACKYSETGTDVLISARTAGREVLIGITDQGTGVPAEEQENIFQRLYRIKRTSPVEGLGLGLTLCKGLVEAHGGRIWVESQVDKGSTFYFTIPL